MQDYLKSIYQGKTVLLTGNTGFKGSWMTTWLIQLNADVVGYALEPPTNPSIYDQLDLKNDVKQYIKDVRSLSDLEECIENTKPDIIFHLAAQPLVRDSYKKPYDTIDTNVMGTVHVLEAIHQLNYSTNVIIITTDKCYENKEWLFGYRENDSMGGHDPYSASKGAAEILTASYTQSFFNPHEYDKHKTKVATVRAGNVIGGGDWAKDRIVPDCIRALSKQEEIFVRNPHATRPWQHVLEPLGGYLLLGAKLLDPGKVALNLICDAFNFGPIIYSNKTVKILVEEILKNWGEGRWKHDDIEAVHEASLLNLTIDKAYHILGWQPLWNFEKTVAKTIEWYKISHENGNKASLKEVTLRQIREYSNSFQLV